MKRTRNASVEPGAADPDSNDTADAIVTISSGSSRRERRLASPERGAHIADSAWRLVTAPADTTGLESHDLNGSSDAAAATTRLLSPSSDPSALKRRRLEAPATDDVHPPSDALVESQPAESEPVDHALQSALAQAHEGDFAGHLGQDEDGFAVDGLGEANLIGQEEDDRRLAAAEAAQLLQIFQAFVTRDVAPTLSAKH